MLGFPQSAHWSTGNVHRVRGITDIGHAVIDPPTEDGHGEKLSSICLFYLKNKVGGFFVLDRHFTEKPHLSKLVLST